MLKRQRNRKGISALDKSSLLGVRPSGVEIKQMESIELKLNLMMDYIVKQSNQMDKMQKELKILRNSTTKVIPEESKNDKHSQERPSESVSHSSSSSDQEKEFGKCNNFSNSLVFDGPDSQSRDKKSNKSHRGITFDHVR